MKLDPAATSVGLKVWNAATRKVEKFKREHGGLNWLEHHLAPRTTHPAEPIPPDDGSLPWAEGPPS